MSSGEKQKKTSESAGDSTAVSSYMLDLISRVGIDEIVLRMEKLQKFNALLRFRNVQRLVDMSPEYRSYLSTTHTDTLSLGQKLHALSALIFLDNKMLMLRSALELTKSEHHLGEVVIDQYRAMRSAERDMTHPAHSESVFCQAFHTLYGREHHLFRSMNLEQSIHVTFRGSPVVDVGGVFREMMSSLVESVFSNQVTLLVPTPNRVTGVGPGRDLYVPNPDATTPLEVHMFEFLGIVMGIAIRNKFPLPFRFPSFLYRRVLQHQSAPFVRGDLAQTDYLTHEYLENIESGVLEHDDIDGSAQFRAQFNGRLFWTASSVTGAVVELPCEHPSKAVTFEERRRYCDAVRQYRHSEFEIATRALRRGITTVIPSTILRLFTTSELEVLVCGTPEISVDYLQRHTKYEHYTKSSLAIRNFWHVFEEMSQTQRSLFIKFVWGRQRLPRGNDAWKQPFTISRAQDTSMLPVAHTCFFKIDLPPYKTVETMRRKLFIAMDSANAPISMLLA